MNDKVFTLFSVAVSFFSFFSVFCSPFVLMTEII